MIAIKGDKFTQVLDVFKNGKVAYTVGSWANTFIGDVKDFSKRVKCIKNICEGDKIIARNNNEIIIQYLFENGKAMYTMEPLANIYVGDLNSLTK